MRTKLRFAMCLALTAASWSAQWAQAEFRVRNNTEETVEVNVNFVHWGRAFVITETGWKQLKPRESFDPDPGFFGLGKIYFLAARYAGGPQNGSLLPANNWRKYEAGKYSIAASRAHFDPKSSKLRQLNDESVLEEIKKGNWEPLKRHWPGIRWIAPAAKIMPLSDTYGSFQIDIHAKRCVTRIWKESP